MRVKSTPDLGDFYGFSKLESSKSPDSEVNFSNSGSQHLTTP